MIATKFLLHTLLTKSISPFSVIFQKSSPSLGITGGGGVEGGVG